MNGPVFGAETAGKGTAHVYFDSLSLKKLTDDPPTEAGQGKIYYKGAGTTGGIDSNTVLLLHMDGTGNSFTEDRGQVKNRAKDKKITHPVTTCHPSREGNFFEHLSPTPEGAGYLS